MPFDELGYEEQTTSSESGPSPEELAAQDLAEKDKAEKEKELELARAQARAEQMERLVREGFAQGREPVQPIVEAQEAAEELGLTEAEILQDPTGAIAKISEQMRLQRNQFIEYQQRVGTVVGNLAKSNFKSEMQGLKSEEFSEWLTPHVEDYFRKNPEEALREGSVRRIYNELVGQNYSELQKLKTERAGMPQRQKVVEPAFKASSVLEPEKKSPALPEDELFMLNEHNRKVSANYRMTQDEWTAIRGGKKYPKKISSDIQYRGAKPNVSY